MNELRTLLPPLMQGVGSIILSLAILMNSFIVTKNNFFTEQLNFRVHKSRELFERLLRMPSLLLLSSEVLAENALSRTVRKVGRNS